MTTYDQLLISEQQAMQIAHTFFGLSGKITRLTGELDFNFKIDTGETSFVLKVARPDVDEAYIDFQQKIIAQVAERNPLIRTPRIIPDRGQQTVSTWMDEAGLARKIRLLTWTDGRLWSSVHPHTEGLLYSLGEQAGLITQALSGFDHPKAHRSIHWDIDRGDWTFEHIHLFSDRQAELAAFFQNRFRELLPALARLRKGVIHNDANDNNIVVSSDLVDPQVLAIIDYGDAVFSSLINDLAVAIAYAIMDKPDPLAAALLILSGYHHRFSLLEDELEALYTLVAMRLIISVTKSAINKRLEPDNVYLLISEKSAWELLEKWAQINPTLAYCHFRAACGYPAHPTENAFHHWVKAHPVALGTLFPGLDIADITPVDLHVGSTWLGNRSEFSDNDWMTTKLLHLQKQHPRTVIAGGYLETRPFYTTDAFKKEGIQGPEYRTVHLGIDFWLPAQTPIHVPYPGKVFCITHNDFDKDYGPTLIVEHSFDGHPFYTLYGHLTFSSLTLLQVGQTVQQGDLIAYIGADHENGNWSPHLHFQCMLDLLGNTANFPGVAFPKQTAVWSSICPDPNLFFQQKNLPPAVAKIDPEQLLSGRKKHLGRSLSISYQKPLTMLRGDGVYLLDHQGQKYLDTVNNVAHVGHEHPHVVQAGQQQMALLNTNTRYLHPAIVALAETLLATFPPELSVVHFVNSGSEANELALRMAKTYTRQRDMIAVEVGYHGNTNATIDVSSYKFDSKGGSGKPAHTHLVPLPDTFRGRYQGENTVSAYAAHVQTQIEYIQSLGRNVAAFICESIISCGGQIELPENYLRLAYAAVQAAGGLCIADEVQVGCGRVGSHFWGFQLHGVIPDIVTIGKPLGNGHPLAAVVCTAAVADAFANGLEFFNTFGGNPVSCAIGKAVLDVVRAENLQQQAWEVGNYLKNALRELQHLFPIIAVVRGQGLFLGFELTDAHKNPLPQQTAYLANRMRQLGVLMSTDGPDHNVLKIKPPMVFGLEHADELIDRLAGVFKEDFMREF
jgi:4-aminobutyrate aminotransferase-like enzyme/Ser/Thr protein kinase RdoA (MazF antagonist)